MLKSVLVWLMQPVESTPPHRLQCQLKIIVGELRIHETKNNYFISYSTELFFVCYWLACFCIIIFSVSMIACLLVFLLACFHSFSFFLSSFLSFFLSFFLITFFNYSQFYVCSFVYLDFPFYLFCIFLNSFFSFTFLSSISVFLCRYY